MHFKHIQIADFVNVNSLNALPVTLSKLQNFQRSCFIFLAPVCQPSSLQRSNEVPNTKPSGVRTAPSTPSKQAGLQWLPLGGESTANTRPGHPSDRTISLNQERGITQDLTAASSVLSASPSTVYKPPSSATLPRKLSDGQQHRESNASKADMVYFSGQTSGTTMSQTLPRGFGVGKDAETNKYGSTPSVYATKRYLLRCYF